MPRALAALLSAGVHILLPCAAGSAIQTAPLPVIAGPCLIWKDFPATTAREPILLEFVVGLLRGLFLAGVASRAIFWQRGHTGVKACHRLGFAALATTQILGGAATGQALPCVLFFELRPWKSILDLSDFACAAHVFHGA